MDLSLKILGLVTAIITLVGSVITIYLKIKKSPSEKTGSNNINVENNLGVLQQDNRTDNSVHSVYNDNRKYVSKENSSSTQPDNLLWYFLGGLIILVPAILYVIQKGYLHLSFTIGMIVIVALQLFVFIALHVNRYSFSNLKQKTQAFIFMVSPLIIFVITSYLFTNPMLRANTDKIISATQPINEIGLFPFLRTNQIETVDAVLLVVIIIITVLAYLLELFSQILFLVIPLRKRRGKQSQIEKALSVSLTALLVSFLGVFTVFMMYVNTIDL